MRKHRTSDTPIVSSGRKYCDGVESEQASELHNIESNGEVSEEYRSQPASDSDNYEPSEDSAILPSPDEANDQKLDGKSSVPFKENVSQSFLDSSSADIEQQSKTVPTNTNKKKRSLDAASGTSGPLELFQLAKRCITEEILNRKLDVGDVVTPPRNKTGTPNKSPGDAASENQVNTGSSGKRRLDVGDVVTPPRNKTGTPNKSPGDAASENQVNTGSSGKRRRSRWEPENDTKESEDDRTSKRRKTRWHADDSQLKMLGPIQLPDFVKVLVDRACMDPEAQELDRRLSVINEKLKRRLLHDDRPERERSPSPPPVYDNLGIRINSRDVRYREKLVRERQDIISRLIQKNPTFRTPPDYKPPKLYKKLYIPIREYPEYNFVGLIMGPRGNTHKSMEKNTGARIVLRGKGSFKERRGQQKPDPSDNEDLHILVEADNQKSLDKAVSMVEKLLIPVTEGMNDHKRAQLQELAKLKGTPKDESCRVCGEEGHMHYACPKRQSTFDTDASCNKCGNDHPTASCPFTVPRAMSTNVGSQYQSYIADFSGGGKSFSTPPISHHTALGTPTSYGSYSSPGLGSTPTTDGNTNKEADDRNLFVGQLPQTVDESRLMGLFSTFGRIIEVKVIKDRGTGMSKGYGFVKYDTPVSATTAVANMNRYKIEGKVLQVRVAGHQPAAGSSSGLLPKYPGTVSFRGNPSPVAWPGPPGSMLPESQSPFALKSVDLCLPPVSIFPGHSSPSGKQVTPPYGLAYQNESLGLPPSSVFRGHNDSFANRFQDGYGSPYQNPISSPSDLARFPGNPDYPISQFQSYFTPTQTLGSKLTPR